MLRKAIVVMVTAVLAAGAGCESHAEARKAAQERWGRTSARIKLAQAQQQYDSGKYEQAAKTVRQCIDADPKMAKAHLLFGKLLLAQGKTEDAENELQVSLELNKGLHEGWYWLGVAAHEGRNYVGALENYKKALALEPTNVDYILAVAEIQVARDNCPAAIDLLTHKMAALPRDVSLKVAAADLMLRVGRKQRAIGLYRQAMLMTHGDQDIAEALGFCYLLSGKWSEAAELFNGLVNDCEDESRRKLYLRMAATCSMNSAQYDRAITCYGKLSVEERKNPEIWVRMGQAALGAGMIKRALMCGQKAVALRPGYPDAIALTGCAQYASGNYAAAAAGFEKIAVDKEDGEFYLLMLGRCYEQLGQTKRAERAYKKALEINPRSTLGDFLVKGRDVHDW
ncbi:MAG: tetratricopeptide repeat protein [Planctomycetota bacterium]|jgi:tetratricopeptide (TPR) repeat protein